MSASMPADEGPSYVELATLAMKATPGPWKPDAVYVTAEVQGGRPGGEVIVWAMATASSHRDEARDRRNAAFIAAANPSTILDLIEKLDTEIGKRRYFEAEYRRLTQG